MYIWDILWLCVHVYGVPLLVYFAVCVFIVQLCLPYSNSLGLILKHEQKVFLNTLGLIHKTQAE